MTSSLQQPPLEAATGLGFDTDLRTRPRHGTGLKRLWLAAIWVWGTWRAVPAAAQANEAVSTAHPTLVSDAVGAGGSWATSADGRFVVFDSWAPNVSPNQSDTNDRTDVFLFDRANGARTLVSHVPGLPSRAGNGRSYSPSISGDGNHVVFVSDATDLVPGDSNGASDVFLFERTTGSVTLLSHAAGAPATPANGASFGSAISADGAWVALTSFATDLVPGTDTNGDKDVFLLERASGTVTLVSHSGGLPGTAGNGPSHSPLPSADGRFISYMSKATDIASGPFSYTEQVFLHDRLAGTSLLVTHVAGSTTTASDGYHNNAVIDASGDHVAFDSDATDLVAGAAISHVNVFVYDRPSGSIGLVSHAVAGAAQNGNGDSTRPRLSGDGRFVVFGSEASDLVAGSDSNLQSDAFLYDAATGLVTLVSHSAGAPLAAGNGRSDGAEVSGDGRFVSFTSRATDLVAGSTDTPGTQDVFCFDRVSGTLVLASHRFDAPTVTASDATPGGTISADGSSIVLYSYASDLTADVDSDGEGDVFLFDRAQGSSRLVSRRDDGLPGLTANADSYVSPAYTVVSTDGRMVAFQSVATNLVPGFSGTQFHPYFDANLFLRDRLTGVTALVNHVAGSSSVAANRGADSFNLSGDGRYLTFASQASNLLASGSQFGAPNVYLFDRDTGSVSLVSHAPGQPEGATFGRRPVISADGGWIAFYSASTDLVPGTYPPGGDNNVFLFERATGNVSLVSHALGAPTTGAGNYQEVTPDIDAGGRYVVFDTASTNLVPGSDTNGDLDVFLYDRATGVNALVSHAAGSPSTAAQSRSHKPILSADGEYVAFQSYATDIVPGTSPGSASIYLYERAVGDSVLASHAASSPTSMPNAPCDFPQISADGGLVTFDSVATDLVPGIDTPFPSNDVFAFERPTGSVRLVSHALAGQNVTGNAPADFASSSVSGDGSLVAFTSLASDLVAGTDDNGRFDVFLWERSGGGLSLVSHTFADASVAAPRDDVWPYLSADGNFAVYSSASATIAAWDYNGAFDVFAFGPLHATADIAVAKTDGQANADPGAPLTYTLTASNPGLSPVFAAVLADTFPPEVLDVTWQCVGSGGAGCGVSGGQGDVATTLGLPVGGSAVVTATGTLSSQAAGTLVNTATLAMPAGVSDVDPGNNTATDVDSVTPAADVSVAQVDAPDPVLVGGDVSYTVTVANAGPAPATGIVLVDTLPPGTTFVSSTPGPPTCTLAAGTLTCGLGTLAGSTGTTVLVAVETASLGAFSNAAAVAAVELDPVPSNDASTETTLAVARRVGELVPGSADVRDLAPATNPLPDTDLYRIAQQPRSSYEVVVDAVSGDLGSGSGPGVDRVAEDGATVVQSSTAAGAGGSRALRWENPQSEVVADQYVRLTSQGCSPCDPEDVYRIRAWETTANGPRFNNSGTQVTVLVLQNATERPVAGTLWLYGSAGGLLASQPLSLQPRGVTVVNTANLAPAASGTFRVSHDGGLGALSGKAVAVEPSTGFTFDTPLTQRPQ